MGGALALLAAEHAKVDAAVAFYGTPVGHKELSHVRMRPAATRSGAANDGLWLVSVHSCIVAQARHMTCFRFRHL